MKFTGAYSLFLVMRLKDLLEVGVYPEMSSENRRRAIFSNAVYIITGGLLLMGIVLRFRINFLDFRSLTIAEWTPIIIVVASLICLLLNSWRQSLVSRVLFLVVWVLFVMVLPVIFVGPKPYTYFAHVYFGIIFSPVVHLFFSNKDERFFFYFFLSVFFLNTVLSLDFLAAFDRSASPGIPLMESTVGMRINHFIFWAFLNLLAAYVLGVNERQNQQLENQQLLLSNQNQELEKRVKERTEFLTEQNHTLAEYAFMNSHVLRAPVSRIRGLLNLLNMPLSSRDETAIKKHLTECAEELDQAVRTISDKLNERA